MPNPLSESPPYYDIEHATAHHEAVMCRAKTAILNLLEGQTPRNRHLVKATISLLDFEYFRLQQTIADLETAVLSHYNDPADREVSEANLRRAEELSDLTVRYDHHINTYFRKPAKYTDHSVVLILTTFPVMNLTAVQQLNSELAGRDPGDSTYRGYRDAMVEVADTIPDQRIALLNSSKQRLTADQTRRFDEAIRATDATLAIAAPHRKPQPPPEDTDL